MVRSIPSGTLYPGPHSIDWNGRDSNDADVPSGIYFCRISIGEREASAKAVLAR
jgi:flagellar hook assembly protein FlgD